jgi:Tfp pilus assembly protein FimV
VRNGKLTAAYARREYGVITDPHTPPWTCGRPNRCGIRCVRPVAGRSEQYRYGKDPGATMTTRSTIVGFVSVIGMTLALITPLQAFSVGDMVVQSHRGAPFLAEVPLTLNHQERDRGVVVALGDREEYRAEGRTRAEVIDHLDVSWQTGARDAIRIASTIPVQMPAFHLVLLVRSGQVTMVRTYHVALPALLATPRTTARSSPPPRSKPQKVSPAPKTPSTPPKTVRTPALPSWQQRLPKRYGPVEKGTTLYSIMERFGVPGKALWQTLVLIWQANKPQFAGGNLHGLRSGVYLAIPFDLAEGIAAMSTKKAQRMVAEQWEAWQALRYAVSGQQRVPPSQKETAVLPAEQGSPTAGVADVQSVLQGLEGLLAQWLPQAGEAGNTTSFVRATELQTALQGLEERLTHRVHETLQQIAASQKASQRSNQPAVETRTLLEHVVSPSSMVYVLVVENALLFLLAGGILWRWYRSRV